MPLHFGHSRSHSRQRSEIESPPAIPELDAQTSPRSSRGSLPHSDAPPPTSILRRSTQLSATSSEYTGSSGSGSAYLSKRLSNLSPFDHRSDTIDSHWSADGDADSTSTPGTSVSSLSGQCPLPESSATKKFPFFVMTISSTSTLSFIALPVTMRPLVLDAIHRAWKRGVAKTGQVEYQAELMKRHKDKGCDGGVWEVSMKDTCWMPKSEDKVASKRIILNLMTEFAREGYDLTSSFRTSAKDSGKDTLIFSRGEPDPDPVFFAVAFHSSDRVWIIDAEADVGQALEDGIKASWVDGIRDARVRERHCREIRLRGNPWTAHSTAALISARCIHLVIMKHVTHFSRGYDFVGSVDMADREEGEMPVTFYRRKWAKSSAIWGEREGVHELKFEPVSEKAAQSMHIGR